MSGSEFLPSMSTTDLGMPKQCQAAIPERIAEFQILGILGQGGMGVVYRAAQENPRREVAIKVMRPGVVSAGRLRRFEHEKHAMGRLQHPGIAQVYVAGVNETPLGAQPYMAMEFVRGVTLSEYVEAHRPSVRERLQLMLEICDAVQHAHLNGVIHRDLKPGNILVDENGRPKVVDFGVARLVDTDAPDSTVHTVAGQLVGTLPYMSPEQAGGEPDAVDLRSDVYALGVICYELLAERAPYDFGARAPLDIIRAIENQEPMPLSKHNRALKGDLDVVLGKALEKDRSRRYQSASEFASDLSRYLAEEPVSARPASTWYQLKKLAGRHPAATFGLGASLLLLMAYGVTIRAQWQREHVLWQREHMQRTKAEELADENGRLAHEKGRLLEEKETLLGEKDRLLGERALQAASLATQRGRWTVALEKLDEARGTTVDAREVRLSAAIANFHLNRTAEARRELDSLATEPLAANQAARVAFWRGAVIADNSSMRVEARELLQQSLESQSLTASERSYAEALLAKETPKRIERLRSAVKEDPFFLHAHQLLLVHLTFLGDFDGAAEAYTTASLLFPDDPGLQLIRAIPLAVEGKTAEAYASIETASKQFGPQQAAVSRAVVDVMDLFGQFGRAQYPKENIKSLMLLTRMTPAFQRLGAAIAACEGLPQLEQGRTGVSSGASFFLDSYRHLAVALLQYSIGDRSGALAQMDDAIRVHPEGFLLAMRGQMHYNAGRIVEAGSDFQAAVNGPMLFPVRGLALDMLFDCQWQLAVRQDASLEDKDRCRATMRRLLDYHRETDGKAMRSDLAWQLIDISTVFNDFILARQVLDFCNKKCPPSAAVKYMEAELETVLGNYYAALLALREAQKLPAEDKVLKQKIEGGIRELTEKCRKQAAELLRETPSPASAPSATTTPGR